MSPECRHTGKRLALPSGSQLCCHIWRSGWGGILLHERPELYGVPFITRVPCPSCFSGRIAKPGHFSLREHLSLLKGSQKLSVLIGGGISSTVLNGAFSWPLCGPSSLWFIQQVFLKSFLWTWHHATFGDIENSNSLCHIGALQYSRRDKCWSVYK